MSKIANHMKMHPLPWDHQTHELSEGYSTIIYDANGVRPTLDHLREDEAALIVTAVNAFEPMKEALKELEDANDALCAIRSQAAYDQMIADGNGDALARLDRARLKAHAALRLAEGEKE